MAELEKLYIVRNEAAKTGDIETVNNITEELNNLYPVKPKSVLCIDGKPVQFEIIGLDRYVEDNPRYGHRFHINGKETYARILIKKFS